jgi:tetratricopeptide (TPR) repeat protein
MNMRRRNPVFLFLLGIPSVALAQTASGDMPNKVKDLIARKQLPSAEKVIVSEMMARPRDPELMTLLAQVRFYQAHFHEALTLVNNADRLGGMTAGRATLAGMIEISMNRLERAAARLRRGIELDPSSVSSHYLLARVLYTQNHFDEAIAESKKAIRLSPNLVRAYENIGLCFEGKQQFEDAEYWYLEAIHRMGKGGKNSEWPMLDLAAMLIRNNQAERARPYLEQALEINPQNAQGVFQRGVLRESSGDLRGALQDLKKATELDPKLETAYYRSAQIHQKLGEMVEAQKDFTTFKALSKEKHSQSPSIAGVP